MSRNLAETQGYDADGYPIPQFATSTIGRVTSYSWAIFACGLMAIENTQAECLADFLRAHLDEYGVEFEPVSPRSTKRQLCLF